MLLLIVMVSLYLAVALLCIVSLCRAAANRDEWQREALNTRHARLHRPRRIAHPSKMTAKRVHSGITQVIPAQSVVASSVDTTAPTA